MLAKAWNKRHLLLAMAIICVALYFAGSNLPDPKILRPFGYLCLGMGGMLNLMTTN